MKVADLRRLPKSVNDWGHWETTKACPSTAFPLSKSTASLRINGYEWRLVKFETDKKKYRLLVAVHFAKEQYYGVLGLECGHDMKRLASLEFHGTHPGWHVHGTCGDIEDVPVGRYKGPWCERVPGAGRPHRQLEFGLNTQERALLLGCEFFGILNNDSKQEWLV